MREYLVGQGLTEAEMLPLKSPAGLDIHSRRGDEIALSIMAEIVQKRRETNRSNAVAVSASTHNYEKNDVGSDLTTAPENPELVRIDPVCGMQVEISSAKYTYDHAGKTYYFCSAGCQKNFSRKPDQYLGAIVPSGEALDPVCQMTVDIATAQYMSEYDGQLVYFCSAGCKKEFDQHPGEYIRAGASGDIQSV